MKDISYNFGAIRDSIAKLSSIELIKSKESITLNEFIKKTKESPNLKKQQLIFKNIQNCKPFSKERLAERFLNQNLSMFKNSKWQQIIKENKDIRKSFLGNPDISHVEAKKDGKLFEAINILIESVSNTAFSDFEKENSSYEMVIEHLTREVDEDKKSKEVDDAPSINSAWKYITKNAVNNFNERYEHLNESEKEVLGILISDKHNKAEYLNTIKNENVTIIDNLIEGDVDKMNQDILIEFKEKLKKMENISINVIDDYILECVELKYTLKELKDSI